MSIFIVYRGCANWDSKIIDLLYMSKIVKRIKEQKFTSKRSPYKRYQKSNWKWDDIL
jgi:hypothetical protein